MDMYIDIKSDIHIIYIYMKILPGARCIPWMYRPWCPAPVISKGSRNHMYVISRPLRNYIHVISMGSRNHMM